MTLNFELPDEALDKLAQLIIAKLRETGELSPAKLWLSMDEAVEESGLSEWEIRKRLKVGTVAKHQPNPGKPPLLINRDSLLRSMVVESRAQRSHQ